MRYSARAGAEEALEAMRGDGQATMETTRTLVREMLNTEQQQLQAQREVWEGAFAISAYLTWGSAAVLLLLTCASAVMTMAEYRGREVELDQRQPCRAGARGCKVSSASMTWRVLSSAIWRRSWMPG